ncbi:MAG: LamG domain-containing protein [Armatimonadetes bacterium]|nr:LamG domain-containing protein [Armatimonadota bacterium]
MTRPACLAAILLLACRVVLADDVLRYDFAGDRPFVVDLSGHLNHGLAHEATRVTDEGRSCLSLGQHGFVRLPEAELLLGKQPLRGFLELSLKPGFEPSLLSADTWEGWVALIYIQKTSGNGLPDGANEIGLALHGPKLIAKVVGPGDYGPFAVIDCPLKRGQWTTLRMEWEPGRRALYVDGNLAAEKLGDYAPPELDMFPAFIGRHPSSGKWNFGGLVADVAIGR